MCRTTGGMKQMAKFVAVNSHNSLFVLGSLDSLLPVNSVARVLFEALEQMDFSAFDAKYRNDETGRPAIEPRRLAAVWMLGLVRGTTSSVALARQCTTDIELRWLLGDAPVQKSTLCDFRKHHLEDLQQLSTQVLALLARAGQLPGKDLVLDGTIVEAASSCAAVKERGTLKKRLAELEQKIKEKLEEQHEEPKEVEALERRTQRIQRCLAEMEEMGLIGDKERVTVTEPEASLKKLKRGNFAPAHNVQAVTDATSGAIITMVVIPQGNDQGQLEAQVQRADEELRRVAELAQRDPGRVERVAADSAYHDARQLARLQGQEILAAVPDGQQNRRPTGVDDAYLASAFAYDTETDTMICPQGKLLHSHGMNAERTAQKYRARSQDCAGCPAKQQCCPNARNGRSVNRSLFSEPLQKTAAHVASEEGQRMLKARSATSEGNFARIKNLLHWRRCRTWGKMGASAEALWRQITHNVMLLTGQWAPMVLKPA